MKLLLDTHAFLWFVGDDSQLTVCAKEFIENPEHCKLVASQAAGKSPSKQG